MDQNSSNIYIQPQLAHDLDSILELTVYFGKKYSFLSSHYNNDVLINLISDTLANKNVGDSVDHIANSILHYLQHISQNMADDLFSELSLLTSLPVPYLKSEEGVIHALALEGYNVNKLNKKLFYSLPGTNIINSSLSAYEILSLWRDISSGEIVSKVISIWNCERTYRSLEDSRIYWSKKYSVDHLINSLISFESTKHVNLVWHEANKLEKIIPNIDAKDMLTYGYMGLRTALRLFDPSLGFKFSTYACARINGTIRDGIRAESHLPKRLTTFSRQISATENDLQQTLGRTPTLKEISEKLGVEIAKLEIMPRLAPASSLDEILESKGEYSWDVNNYDPLTELIKSEESLAVQEALAKLTEEERQAISYTIFENYSPQKIKELSGRPAKEIKEIKDLAIIKLREDLNLWTPKFIENE